MSDTSGYKGKGLCLLALFSAFCCNVLGLILGLVGCMVYSKGSGGWKTCFLSAAFSLVSLFVGIVLYF